MNFYPIANAFMMFSSFISILFNLTILIIHIKQPLLKCGFFNVVFGQVITEFFININIFFISLFYLIYDQEFIGKWFVMFPIFFNYFYEANIIYNISIIICLMTFNRDKTELINYAIDNDITRSSDLSHQNTLVLEDATFKKFHFISYSISTIYIFFYILNLYVFQGEDLKIQENDWNWYFYFICGKKYFWRIFFFLFHILFFFISIIYLTKSFNKNKISNHIYLRSYAIFCFFNSLISLLFPITLLIFMIGFKDDPTDFTHDYLILIILAILFFFIATAIFRLNNYYVYYVLTEDGKGCLNWFRNIFNVLFCCKKMKELNIIDYDGPFILHALSSFNDLIIENISGNILTSSIQKELFTADV